MFAGREKYWGKVAVIAFVSFMAIVAITFFLADYVSAKQNGLNFNDEAEIQSETLKPTLQSLESKI